MEIVLLHVPNCPNRTDARRNLDAALSSAQLDALVAEREVLTAEEARAVGMNGSPTILVDGADLFPAEALGTLACRLYRDERGLRGAPSVEAIVDRLAS